MPSWNDDRLLNVYAPAKLPGKKLRIRSNCRSPPARMKCAPRTQVTVSAICPREIVVSRGLKLLRPIVRTVEPPWRTSASGRSLLANPGSLSRAHCPRASFSIVLPSELLYDALRVRVCTFEAPVCSSAFCGPPFSKFLPVKF